MKLKLTISLIFSLLGGAAVACDICGCGVGSYYIGILPEYNKRFVGLRYQHKTLQTHLGPGTQRTPITADETYQTAELWGGWNIGKKFRVLAFVPYNFNHSESQAGNGSKKGLGDIAIMGYYNVFNNIDNVGEKLLVQSLWIGTGIKVPTGKYEATERLAVQESPNNFQLGTASTDFSFNAAYDIRYNDLGLNANLNYKVNTENKYNYRYGNKLSINTLVYYKFRIINAITFAPNMGMLYETAQKDVENKKYPSAVSGGYSLAMVAGAEFTMNGLSFGMNYQNVQKQNLAGRRAYSGNRLMVHFAVPF